MAIRRAAVEYRDMERERGPDRTTPGERFGRALRLRSQADFQRVQRSGRRRHGRYMTLVYAQGEPPDGATVAPPRVGFSVNKRVGDAVRRNRVKRRLREAVRRQLWNVAPGWDMILIARPEAASAPYTTLRDEVGALLTQARLLRVTSDLPVTGQSIGDGDIDGTGER